MNNKSVIIICSTVTLLIIAGLIMFIVWQKNRNRLNQTDMYSKALDAINTQFDFGTNIYDVMLSGQRNDSTASAGKNNGSSLLGI